MTSHLLRRTLRDALRRGVKIRVVADPHPLGQQCPLFFPTQNKKGMPNYRLAKINDEKSANDDDCRDQRRLAHEIIAKQGIYTSFNKAELCPSGNHCFQHGKLAIIDDHIALLSSGNFDSSNLCELATNPLNAKKVQRCNRDYSFVFNSSVSEGHVNAISLLKKIFEKDLSQKNYDLKMILTKAPTLNSPQVSVSPHSLEPLINFINTAEKTLLVQNQYMQHPKLNEALVNARKRGVQVSLSLASLCSFGMPSSYTIQKARNIFTSFDKVGIVSRFFSSQNLIRNHPGYMHAKAMVADGKRAWLGSNNGSLMSLSKNREFGVFFDDPADVKALEKSILQDLASPGNSSWQESIQCIKESPLSPRFKKAA